MITGAVVSTVTVLVTVVVLPAESFATTVMVFVPVTSVSALLKVPSDPTVTVSAVPLFSLTVTVTGLEVKDALNNGSVSYSLRQRQTDHAPDAEIKNIEKKLSRLDSKELRAKEAYIDGIDTIEEYRANKERISQERTELEEQLAKLTQVPEEPEDNTRKMLQSISSILDILQSDSFTPQEKNAALKSIVEKITYDRANSHIDVDFYLTENPEMPANP